MRIYPKVEIKEPLTVISGSPDYDFYQASGIEVPANTKVTLYDSGVLNRRLEIVRFTFRTTRNMCGPWIGLYDKDGNIDFNLTGHNPAGGGYDSYAYPYNINTFNISKTIGFIRLVHYSDSAYEYILCSEPGVTAIGWGIKITVRNAADTPAVVDAIFFWRYLE